MIAAALQNSESVTHKLRLDNESFVSDHNAWTLAYAYSQNANPSKRENGIALHNYNNLVVFPPSLLQLVTGHIFKYPSSWPRYSFPLPPPLFITLTLNSWLFSQTKPSSHQAAV